MQEMFVATGIGLLWGITNPLLEQGAKTATIDPTEPQKTQSCFVMRWAFFFWNLFANYRFIIPFALNQAGSILFYYALGNSSMYWMRNAIIVDITLVVPVTNCISFTTTYICESLLKGTRIDLCKCCPM